MSRSYKKSPVHTVCIVRAGDMKSWKQNCNRKLRRQCKAMLSSVEWEYINFPNKHDVGNLWTSPCDGYMSYWTDPPEKEDYSYRMVWCK